MSTRNLDAALSVRVSSVRGYSAYEIAVQHGYTGTEEQWLASLSGNNCTINGISHDATYDFKINAANIPLNSGSSNKISSKLTELGNKDTELEALLAVHTQRLSEKLPIANVYNDLDKTVSGYALDARQGAVLKALCDDAAPAVTVQALKTEVYEKINLTTSSVTLTASAWTQGGTQTVTVEGVHADSTVIVAAGSSTIAEYTSKGVYCSSQAEGTLTFSYTTLPTVDLAVNIMNLHETETTISGS